MPVKAYWVCRQEAGFQVFWRCQGASEAMKQCVSAYTGHKERFEAYRDARLADLAPAYFAQRERMLGAKLHHYTAVEQQQQQQQQPQHQHGGGDKPAVAVAAAS